MSVRSTKGLETVDDVRRHPRTGNTEPEPNGDIFMYPGGHTSAPPSGRMPKGGRFVFNTTHNVHAKIPRENLVALYEAVRDYRQYA